jgi:hypothetical protein
MRGSAKPDPDRRRRPRHRRARAAGFAAWLVETGALWWRSGRLGGNVVVRCRSGHLYTTVWVPGASVKSLRLGLWRFQHCPVGGHWSIVTPVRESELTWRQKRSTRANRDIRVP